MLIGLVKWFDSNKGFGIVGMPNEEEFFLHINSFLKKPENISKGSSVIFSNKIDKSKNRKTAEKSHLVGEMEDWRIIFSYLGKPDNVFIEVEIKERGKMGNPYHRKEIQAFSLIKRSVTQFLKGKSEIEIIEIITDYFDKNLDKNYFIPYCEYIEKGVNETFSNEESTAILNRVFSYFGKRLDEDILFNVWKKKKFKFISYTDEGDYEIPEGILMSNISEIGVPELTRILNYSFGYKFYSYFIDIQFKNVEFLSSYEIKNLYHFLVFEDDIEKKKQLNGFYSQKILCGINEEADRLGMINDNNDFNTYKELLKLIPEHFDEESKNTIKKEFYHLVASKCSEEFKTKLWLQGVIEEVPFEFVTKIFLNKDTQTEKRISILSKLQSENQIELLKLYSIEYDFEKTFSLLEELVKKENSLSYYFKLSESLFDTDFWDDKKCNDLINLFNDYVTNKSSDEQKYNLFFNGYLSNIPQYLVYQNIHNLKESDCRKVFQSLPESQAFIKEILEAKATTGNPSDFDWLCSLALKFLDKENFDDFDKQVFETIDPSVYFRLWKIGKAKIFPKNHITKILKDRFESYDQIKDWIDNSITTTEEITNLLFSYLSKQVPVTDRITFYTQINHIKYLLQSSELYLEKIKLFKNDFYNIILWFLDKSEVLDFEQLKRKFIYFEPDNQVRIIRKLFFLKANHEFDLTVEKLDELTRFDLDLYKTNLNFNLDIPIDISTDVIIKVLLTFKKNQRFFIESELFEILLKDLHLNKTKQFKLSHYFEDCLGRQTATYNWSTEGQIKKVYFGNNQFYFAISFSTGKKERWGNREIYSPNPNFEKIKDAVKKLPKVKWNPDEKHWGVPSQFEANVLSFAEENKFLLDFGGSKYANNIHLVEFNREGTPNGISFCEGRLANRPHETFKKVFWWCAGQPCFSKCETIHPKEEWEKYTLLDFCEILGFNTDETNKMGDHIPKGHYYQFIALINRFNRLLEKLYCQECNHILYPSDFGTGHFAAHTIVRFQCRNEKCSNNDEIYLNHCLNRQCKSVIDSRISKRCDNGLFICDHCGSCCSHKMLERRLNNLRLTDIPNTYTKQMIINDLTYKVEQKLGHLERAEYFCYKCNAKMKEVNTDIFQCPTPDCEVKYDTVQYKFSRPHKDLKKTILKENNTGYSNENNDNELF